MSDLGSDHDLTDPKFELSAVRAEPALDPLSPLLSAPPLLASSLSKNIIKIKKKKLGVPGWLSQLGV